MKKVLIFTYSTAQGGSELNALKIIKLSSQVNFDWVVLYITENNFLDKIKNCKNLNNIISLEFLKNKSFKKYKCIFNLIKILKKGDYQTVYAVGFMPALLISFLKIFFPFRFISTRRERMPWAKYYHEPFININGLAKYMIPPRKLDALYKEHGLEVINAKVGDVLFFHTSLIHGSSHNISPNSRMIILSQLNTVGNEPKEVNKNARVFNLDRARRELDEAKRRMEWFQNKYESQNNSEDLTFSAPIPKEEVAD